MATMLPSRLAIAVLLAAAAVATAVEDPYRFPYEYPTTTTTPPEFTSPSEPCDVCPWNRAEMGRYPSPSNAGDSFEPVHRGKYFDVYCPWIETRYSEVFWTEQPGVPLPEDIVETFRGRAISITGFEVDVVSGGDAPEAPEWSVPEFQVYNHHYFAVMRGNGTKMTRIGHRGQDSLLKDADETSRVGRHAIEVHPPEWEPRDTYAAAQDASTIPTAQLLVQGNGGEHRKSFKHLPKGTGIMLYSPTEFDLQPMLINTNFPFREGETPREAFRRGTLPRTAKSPPGADYSGLMECPCTTRTVKVVTGFETRTRGTCGARAVADAGDCFGAASELVEGILANHTVSDDRYPGGCYLVASGKGTEAFFNTPPSGSDDDDDGPKCGARDGVPVRSLGTASLDSDHGAFGVRLELDAGSGNATITLTGPAGRWFAIGFNASSMADTPYTIVVEGDRVVERLLGNHERGSELPPTVEVVSDTVGPAPSPAPVRANHGGTPLGEDLPADDRDACRDACAGTTGCGAWTFFPARFSSPYVLEGASCRLRHADGGGGFSSEEWIDGMWSGVVHSDDEEVRTVVLARALEGEHFSFDPSASAVPFIAAVGADGTFGYHGDKGRGGGHIVLVQTGAPICVCKAERQGGSINGIPWSDNCYDFPATTIKRDHNPSCSIDTYQGGMICCHHGIFLLDADQEIPAPTFRFRMKFRFFYEDPEEIAAASDPAPSVSRLVYPGLDYQNSFFFFRETEVAHGEYDVPACDPGTPPEACVHTITGSFRVHEGLKPCNERADVWCAPNAFPNTIYPQSEHIALLHVSPHCHGPACISMELINTATNETLCYTEPHYGTSDTAMDEKGYAAGIPPCLFGTPEEGLPPPPVVHLNDTLLMIKKVNSTNAHLGVMGHWQMRAIWAAGPNEFLGVQEANDDEEEKKTRRLR